MFASTGIIVTRFKTDVLQYLDLKLNQNCSLEIQFLPTQHLKTPRARPSVLTTLISTIDSSEFKSSSTSARMKVSSMSLWLLWTPPTKEVRMKRPSRRLFTWPLTSCRRVLPSSTPSSSLDSSFSSPWSSPQFASSAASLEAEDKWWRRSRLKSWLPRPES